MIEKRGGLMVDWTDWIEVKAAGASSQFGGFWWGEGCGCGG